MIYTHTSDRLFFDLDPQLFNHSKNQTFQLHTYKLCAIMRALNTLIVQSLLLFQPILSRKYEKGIQSKDYQENLKKFMATHKDANKVLKFGGTNKRLFDPDTWCRGTLSAPTCWEEYAERVWQPGRLLGNRNLVGRRQGRPLKRCVDKCSWADWFKDFAGRAYEENRETREEYTDSTGRNREFYNGCPKCCDKIPKHLICVNVRKFKQTCPELSYRHCSKNNFRKNKN